MGAAGPTTGTSTGTSSGTSGSGGSSTTPVVTTTGGGAEGSGSGTITVAPLTGTGSVGWTPPSLTPQQVLAQRESAFQQAAGVVLKDAGAALQRYRQMLTSVHVVGGIVDSITHDLFNGPILFDPTQRSVAYDIGRLIGDAISIVLGLGTTATGLTEILGGAVLDATGVGAIVGLAVGALGLATTATGAVILTRSVDYGLQDTRALYSKIESGGTKGTDKNVPNPNGKKGGLAHQQTIQSVTDNMRKQGLDVQFEHYVKTPGGYKNSRYGDILVTDPQTGEQWIVQVGKQTKFGNPVSREIKAIQDLQNAGYNVQFVPYN